MTCDPKCRACLIADWWWSRMPDDHRPGLPECLEGDPWDVEDGRIVLCICTAALTEEDWEPA